jgi:hypothetical protein
VLSERQSRLVDLLIAQGVTSAGGFRSVLVDGAPGSGKRTAVRALAANVGAEFAEVPVADIPEAVLQRLQREVVERGDCIVYLSSLQHLPRELFQTFHQMLTSKVVVSKDGRTPIPESVWLVAGLSQPEQGSTIGQEHWLLTNFERRIYLANPTLDEVRSAVQYWLDELGMMLPKETTEWLVNAGRMHGHFKTIRRWIESLQALDDRDPLARLLEVELRWAVDAMEYRGGVVSLEHVKTWVEQFPSQLWPLAIGLVRLIREKYFIGAPKYHSSLESLIKGSRIRTRERVTFCRWQRLGESSPRVAHDIKNQARWAVQSEIDCDLDPAQWPTLGEVRGSPIVVADDFVGSGSRLRAFVRDVLPNLRERYPGSRVVILIVRAFESGLRAALSSADRAGTAVVVGETWSSRDRCFTDDSAIIVDSEVRSELKRFCLEMARSKLKGLPNKMHLGFGDLGALVVFGWTVPNNTLPVIWHDAGDWTPLFPASGIP